MKKPLTTPDRKTVLLKACLDMLKQADDITHTVHYDGTDCDVYCLIEDIENELEEHP